MAGEHEIADLSYSNVLNASLTPYLCVDIDAANSNTVTTACGPCSGANGEVLGVVYDQSHKNPDGTISKNSGANIRSWGVARIIASAAVSAGQYVAVANVAGQVFPAVVTAGGTAPKPIVGRALTSAAALNDRILVLLMIGARY